MFLHAGGVCFLSSVSAPADDGDPFSPSTQQLPQQGGTKGGKLSESQSFLQWPIYYISELHTLS